jgi:hypothetical protein
VSADSVVNGPILDVLLGLFQNLQGFTHGSDDVRLFCGVAAASPRP